MMLRPPLLLNDEPNAAPLGKRLALIFGSMLAMLTVAGGFVFGMSWLATHHGTKWQFIGLAALYAVLILVMVGITVRLAVKFSGIKPSPAMQRYTRRFMIGMSAYVVTLLVAIFTFVEMHLTGLPAYLVALTPALPIAGCVVVMGLYLKEETDEYWRTIQTESALLAVGGMFIVATAWGFLETFKLVPHVPAWAVFPLWAVLLGPSALIVRARYR